MKSWKLTRKVIAEYEEPYETLSLLDVSGQTTAQSDASDNSENLKPPKNNWKFALDAYGITSVWSEHHLL